MNLGDIIATAGKGAWSGTRSRPANRLLQALHELAEREVIGHSVMTAPDGSIRISIFMDPKEEDVPDGN